MKLILQLVNSLQPVTKKILSCFINDGIKKICSLNPAGKTIQTRTMSINNMTNWQIIKII